MSIGSFFKRLTRKKNVQAEPAGDVEKPKPKQIDIFGLLPRDIQIEVLGHVAAYRPAQVIIMQTVCKKWHKILSEDSIYHSAIFTASFSPPPVTSLQAFKDVAFTDDRVRKQRLYSGRSLEYGVSGKPRWVANNKNQPSNVIYRDGFIVWWFIDGACFNYVDLNRKKKSKKTQTIDFDYSPDCLSPLYTQASGKLVFMWPRTPLSKLLDEDEKPRGSILNVVLLQNPLVKGEISLSDIEFLNEGPWEIYSSSNYALVVKGLELLVIDIRDITKMEILHTIHLHHKTLLERPVISNIEISNKDNCLVVLTSAVTGCIESTTYSLTTGLFQSFHTTETILDSRTHFPAGAPYFIQHSKEFSHDTAYQCKNPTHKEHPHLQDLTHHRWLQVPPSQSSKEDCISGTYNGALRIPNESFDGIPSPLANHSVTFSRQAVSFTALQDRFEACSFSHPVDRISLRVATGNLGAERQDTDVKGPHDASYFRRIGSPIGGTGTSVSWTRGAKMLTPADCICNTREGTSTNTQLWSDQRRQWGEHSVLLGDEKGLVLALPHQMMFWRFETQQIWKDRKKRKIKKIMRDALFHTVLLPGYVVVAPAILPFACVTGTKKLLHACTEWRSKKRSAVGEEEIVEE